MPCVVPAAAQSAESQGTVPGFSTQTTLVTVPTLVRDRAGHLVFALSAKDFLLTDDGVRQELVLDPDSGTRPLALVVVIEAGAAGARQFDKLSQLGPLLDSIAGRQPHRLALVAFGSTSALLHPFTSRTDEAIASVDHLVHSCSDRPEIAECVVPLNGVRKPDTGAAILDALGFAVNLLRSQPAGFRKAILLIGETQDRGSQLDIEKATRAISESGVSIYALAFSTAKSEAAHYAYHNLPIREGGGLSNKYPNPPHGCMGKDPNPDPDGPHSKLAQAYDCLVQLAPPLGLAKMVFLATADAVQRNVPLAVTQMTGGEYFRLGDRKSLEQSLRAIAGHIPNRYLLSFQPKDPHPGLHVLSLQVAGYGKDLTVSARRTYWVDPQPASQAQPR